MATFRYQAYGLRGDYAEGAVEALTTKAAEDELWQRGLTPFALRPVTSNDKRWWQREFSFSEQGAQNLPELAQFTRQFATLLSAELPLDDALRMLREHASARRLRELVEGLRSDILNGTTLSDAIAKHPRIFSAEYVSLVRAGELGANIGAVLTELAELLERRVEIRGRIQSALVYPIMLVGLSIVTLIIVVAALVPSIAPIFVEGGNAVPVTVRFFLALERHWPEIIGGMAITGVATAWFAVLALRKEHIRRAFDSRTLQLPLLGSFLLHQQTARFARTLGTLLKAGVPLVQAVGSARTVVTNRHMAAQLDTCIEALKQGSSLHRALGSAAFLPAVATQMVAVGEEAGKLDRILMRVAVMFEQQAQRTIERLMTALTPVLTLTVAFAIGALIIPIINVIVSINDLAGR